MTNDDIKGTIESMAYDITIAINKAKTSIDKAARDGYLGDLYRTDFTVTGRGAFPIDMLRYCNAWPAEEVDAGIIERSHESDIDASDPFTLRLTKYHRDPTPMLADDRWERKFRWKIIGPKSTTRL